MRSLLLSLSALLMSGAIGVFQPLIAVEKGASENGPAVQDQKWLEARAINRKGREAMYKGAAADRADRAKKAALVLVELAKAAEKQRVPGQDADFAAMVKFIERLDAEQAKQAAEALKSLPSEPAMADEKADEKMTKAWERTYASKRLLFTKPTEILGQKALDLGVTDIAFDCLQQVLTFDPDNVSLRKALNQTKVEDHYYGPKDMLFVKAGLRWDKKLGWIVGKEAERYEKGDYFDIQSKKWTTLVEANALRSKPADQWIIQTEHLEIRGTASLQQLVDAANHVEAFYAQIFANYSLFFSKEKNDIKLIFGLLDHPRLVLNIAKDPAAYKASIPSTVPDWAAGIWMPSKNASYFYAGPLGVMYHEFTHQILDIFSGGSRAKVWVVEGVASYTQFPVYENGELKLGDINKNKKVQNHLLRVKSGTAMTLEELLRLTPESWKTAEDPNVQYAAAATLAQFCMEANDRRYRSDYVEFVRDEYLGQSGDHEIWDYLGLTRDEFTSSYKAWEKALADKVKKD
jgi:hypothetical protein